MTLGEIKCFIFPECGIFYDFWRNKMMSGEPIGTVVTL